MASRSSAFCPGHITAFFEICEHEDILRKGSRGAGLCLSKGVISTVEAASSESQEISVKIDGDLVSDSVTELAVRRWLGDETLRVEIESQNQLPVSQGFGMSGAGALSAVIALTDALRAFRSREELVQIAHAAEVESMSGLGDVYPQATGGIVIRELPGAPPHGRVKKFVKEEELVLCVLGERLETRSALRNEEIVERINQSGKGLVEAFMSSPSFESLFSMGRAFAVETKLASNRILEALDACEEFGKAGMSMLGSSVFAFGNTEELIGILGSFGEVIECEVENHGARVIQSSKKNSQDNG